MTIRRIILSACLLMSVTAVGACSSDDDDKAPLPGERISILELQRRLEPDDAALSAQGFVAPNAWKNEFWPQAGGYPNHSMQHLSLNEGALTKIWSASIGEGAQKNLPLLTQPVVVDGRVFTLDTENNLSAFDAKNGNRIWNRFVGSTVEEDETITGGISYSRGQLYVTNGYNELLLLNPQDGKIVWRKKIPSASRAAPTISDDRVFITTLDNKLLALNAVDGSVLWDYSGIQGTAGLVGAASPAASRDIVIPVFSSGEIFALRVENGSAAWGDNLAGIRAASGLSGISDIRALPVIDKGIVVAISFGNRMVALDERTGNRIWQRDIGGSEMPWIAGNYIFTITNDSELVGMGRDNGLIRWVRPLPKFRDPKSRSGAIYWSGPVLAGNRLVLAGTDGGVLEVNPETGDVIRSWGSGLAVSISPVVAGDTLYLLGDNGTLAAYK
jgi:outer membrane protein assembly factor BamB